MRMKSFSNGHYNITLNTYAYTTEQQQKNQKKKASNKQIKTDITAKNPILISTCSTPHIMR